MKIHNSLTRKKDEFIPIVPNKIGLYVCGPTVYDEPHIGHARSAYIFDVIRRYMSYKGYGVTFVRNVTDVDDKIIDKARKLPDVISGSANLIDAVNDVARRYLDSYHEEMDGLGIAKPDFEPKATEYIPKMIKFIELLISNGSAYESEGDVYFNIKKASGYGKLSNQNIENMESGARISSGEKKKDPLDFALWKKAKEAEPSWPSPWGPGRPGWHMECSAMSSDILGDEFDIHGGGIDLIFPHHENEIAQSEGAGKKFARYWIHNGLLTINSEKMAKSLGNYITIRDFIAKHKDPDYMKLFFLSAHYRSPIDYTEDKIIEAKKEKERFSILFKELDKGLTDHRPQTTDQRPQTTDQRLEELDMFKVSFEKAMDDDFNTPLALASLFDLVTWTNKVIHGKSSFTDDDIAKLSGANDMLLKLSGVFGLTLNGKIADGNIDEGPILKMIGERNAARRSRDFKKADDIRKKLADMNVILEDTKDGTEWRIKA